MKTIGFILLMACLFAVMAPSRAQSGSLPVVLVTFNVSLENNSKIEIAWTVPQQVNNDAFDVEKSHDGVSWTMLATLSANGPSAKPVSYLYYDNQPFKGINFYRIHIRNKDGGTGYTATQTILVNKTADIRLFPNPSPGAVNITLGEAMSADWLVLVYNMLGQAVMQKKFSRSSMAVQLQAGMLPNGQYILEITDGTTTHQKQLLINRR